MISRRFARTISSGSLLWPITMSSWPRKNLEIADANLERLTKYRDAAEKRLRVGEVTRTVLLRAEGELSGAKSDQVQAKNGLELAMDVLVNNVGIKSAVTLRETPVEAGEAPALPFLPIRLSG